jgi:hypothetical protein
VGRHFCSRRVLRISVSIYEVGGVLCVWVEGVCSAQRKKQNAEEYIGWLLGTMPLVL